MATDGVVNRQTIQLGVAGGRKKDISILSYNVLSTVNYIFQSCTYVHVCCVYVT